MLGTNDAKTFNYNQTEYIADYISMVKSFQAMTPPPDIYIMIPPPLYKDGVYSMNQTVINDVYPTLIPNIAKQLNIPDNHIVDLFKFMGGKNLTMPDMFIDGCHPNDNGYKVLAQAVFVQMFEVANIDSNEK